MSRAHDICNACARSWFTVRDAVRDVIPAPHPTPWAPAVAEFAAQLCRVFGPPDQPLLSPGDPSSATAATAYRGPKKLAARAGTSPRPRRRKLGWVRRADNRCPFDREMLVV